MEYRQVTITFYEGQWINEGEYLGRTAIENIAEQYHVEPYQDAHGRLCVDVQFTAAHQEEQYGRWN